MGHLFTFSKGLFTYSASKNVCLRNYVSKQRKNVHSFNIIKETNEGATTVSKRRSKPFSSAVQKMLETFKMLQALKGNKASLNRFKSSPKKRLMIWAGGFACACTILGWPPKKNLFASLQIAKKTCVRPSPKEEKKTYHHDRPYSQNSKTTQNLLLVIFCRSLMLETESPPRRRCTDQMTTDDERMCIKNTPDRFDAKNAVVTSWQSSWSMIGKLLHFFSF